MYKETKTSHGSFKQRGKSQHWEFALMNQCKILKYRNLHSAAWAKR